MNTQNPRAGRTRDRGLQGESKSVANEVVARAAHETGGRTNHNKAIKAH